MATIFRRLHRLRKLEERTAQVALADAHAHKQTCEAEVVQLQSALDRSHRMAGSDVALMLCHHRFSLDGELQRRTAVRALDEAVDTVQTAHGEMVHRAQQARTVELLAEAVEEEQRTEARLSEQRMFDEVGTQRWLRRAS